MSEALFLGFVVVSVIGIATPGPDVLLAMHNGSRHGVGLACFGIAGVVVSDCLVIGAIALGLGALLAEAPTAFSALKLAGAAYLSFVGVGLLLTAGQPPESKHDHAGAGARLFWRSLVVAITNVKVWLFLLAFLPQFIDPARPALPQYLLLGVILEAISVVVLLAYATVGCRARRVLQGRLTAWLERGSGVALLTLASLALLQTSTAGFA